MNDQPDYRPYVAIAIVCSVIVLALVGYYAQQVG